MGPLPCGTRCQDRNAYAADGNGLWTSSWAFPGVSPLQHRRWHELEPGGQDPAMGGSQRSRLTACGQRASDRGLPNRYAGEVRGRDRPPLWARNLHLHRRRKHLVCRAETLRLGPSSPFAAAAPEWRNCHDLRGAKGYVDSPEGFPQFGVEALVSRDHGQTWDLDHRYILHHWVGHIKSARAWTPSSQATSTVLLPDGSFLTAFGTGYRCEPDKNIPQDLGLVQWKLSREPVSQDRRIRDAAADSNLHNVFDPRASAPVNPEKTK